MNSLPLLSAVNSGYFSKFLAWRQIKFNSVGSLFKIPGFDQYNWLVDINSIFSSNPFGDIIDRTSTVQSPLNFHINRAWTVPTQIKTLDEIMAERVQFYTAQKYQLNLFWSGGIDSTAMVSAFLQHAPDLTQLRVLYSPYSLYENKNFFEFLEKNYPQLEKIDISGDVYLDQYFDGINIKGHGSDEFTASLDESFVDLVGIDGLSNNWKDFFVDFGASDNLIDFYDQYSSLAGRPINSIIEARWWFYAANKSQVFIPLDRSFTANQSDNRTEFTSAFYDCVDFESYTWANVDRLIHQDSDYTSYKKFLREYTYNFYQNVEYLDSYKKVSSLQVKLYTSKKVALLDLRWIFKLANGQEIRTKNLPLLSKKEYDQEHGTRYDYLFNF